jgi:1-acyl-sn-glycerol-3-phosphate acyltransferase
MLSADPVFAAPSEYRSPPAQPGFFARMFPSLVFYPLFWRQILIGAMEAEAGRYTGERWALNCLEVMRALERVGCRFVVEGLEHLRAAGPCVIAGNHMSTLETVVLPGIIQPRRPVTFVVKRSLTTMPVFRHIMCSRDPVVVDRLNARDDLAAMLRGCKERLEKGISIVVFPQATRSLRFERAKFNSIAVKIAERNGAPLVPLALRTDAWGQGRLFRDYGGISPRLPVRIRFGEPFRVEGSAREGQERLCSFIEEACGQWEADSAVGLSDISLRRE